MIKRYYNEGDKNITVDIDYITIEGDNSWAYMLELKKENSRSIYAYSNMYGWIYRIEKTTGKIFFDKKEIGIITNVTLW